MSEYIKVAVDAMGGDYASQEPVKGVVEALQEKPELYVYLVGQEDVLKKELDKYTYPKERLEVVHASEIIETGEPPVHAIQKKKDSSLVKALRMVRSKEASAFVSCGSTGAVLVGGQVLVGKSKGVERAPLAPLIPTATGVSLLIDCGANVDARSSHLVQFARMGSIYMEYVMGVKNPKVGLVNIGAEEEKGNALVKETYPLLKECKDINFIGNVEARLFGYKLRILPILGMHTVGVNTLSDFLLHFITPYMVLTLAFIPDNVRYVRSSTITQYSEDYVMVQKAFGASKAEIMFKHVCKNVLLPVITKLGMALPTLVTGAVITETVFSWPGIGPYFIKAVQGMDYPIVMIVLILSSTLVVLGNLLSDILYCVTDPRIRKMG